MPYAVKTFEMYFAKTPWEIPIVMIPLDPNDLLAVGDFLDHLQYPLMDTL
jgi:hypothetical protein